MGDAHRGLVVNGGYVGQRVTGQQRYAHEVTRELLARPDWRLRSPGPRLAATRGGGWAWTAAQALGSRRDVLLSLTSRAPAGHPRHVVTVHDLFVLTDPDWFSPQYRALHAPLLTHLLRHARAVVAVSAPVAEQVRGTGLVPPDRPVVVAPNAPTAAPAPGPLGPLASRLAGGPFLLSVGSLEPRKNVARVVEAYGRLPLATRRDVPLVVVGADAPAFAAVDLVLPEGALLAGYLTDEELWSLYRLRPTVVAASLAEGFGLPLVEAGGLGARFVVSDLPVFRWVLGTYPARYVDPLDVEALTEGLRSALDEPATVGSDDVDRLAGRFSWSDTADVVDGLCRAVGRDS